MSFLKRLFGRPRWEEVTDDPEDMIPVWEAPGARADTAAGGAAQAAPGAGAPPPPRFAPGAAPGQVVGGAGQTAGGAPPPRFAPGAAPGQVVGVAVASGGAVVSAAAEEGQEVVLDTVAPDDLEMPEEFRGCQVVEVRYPDGRSEVFYRGSDGFRVDEEAATVLIDAYRAEVADMRRAARTAPRAGAYAMPGLAEGSSVEPRLGGGAPLPAFVQEEVIEELGFGTELPPELRGAKFVRRGSEFRYVTRSGQRFSKDMAEGMMERWERDQAARARALIEAKRRTPPSRAPVESALSGEQAAAVPAAAVPLRPDAPGQASSSAPAPAAPFSPATPPPASRGGTMPGSAVPVADTIDAAIEAAAAGAAADVPAGGTDSAPLATAPGAMSPSEGAIPAESAGSAAALSAAAREAAARLRGLVLDDDPAVSRLGVSPERLKQACAAEITRRRTRHRFEHLAGLSQSALSVLESAWKGSQERSIREAYRDLEQGMLLLGVFNPMTIREIDLAEFLSVVRLRGDERRREIVTSELARRVLEEVPPALQQYLMTRAFVDQSAEAAAACGGVEQGIRGLMEDRLAEALNEVVDEVMRRHGVWLPQVEERLLGRLRPLVDGLLRLALAAG